MLHELLLHHIIEAATYLFALILPFILLQCQKCYCITRTVSLNFIVYCCRKVELLFSVKYNEQNLFLIEKLGIIWGHVRCKGLAVESFSVLCSWFTIIILSPLQSYVFPTTTGLYNQVSLRGWDWAISGKCMAVFSFLN